MSDSGLSIFDDDEPDTGEPTPTSDGRCRRRGRPR